jgi:hypothetical protein
MSQAKVPLEGERISVSAGRLQVPDQPIDGPDGEEIGCIADSSAQPVGPFEDFEEQVELGGAVIDGGALLTRGPG